MDHKMLTNNKKYSNVLSIIIFFIRILMNFELIYFTISYHNNLNKTNKV